MNSARRLIVNNTAVQLFGKFFSTLTTLLTTLLITRFLGAEVYGDFTKVFSTVILLYMVLDFGFNAIVVRRLGLRPAHLSADISNLIVMRLLYAFILSLLLSLFLLASPTPATHGYTLAVKQATLIFSLSFFFQGIFTSLNAVFQHRLNYLPSVLSGSLGNLLILIFTALAELSTRQIAETMAATGMIENAVAGKKGGGIAKKARLDLEEKTGKKVVSRNNYLPTKNNKQIEKK